MEIMIVGKKKVMREDKKNLNIVYFVHKAKEDSGVEGLIAESAFTNDATFDSITVDSKKTVDMAVFYDKGYCNIYNKKNKAD